jgi:signal transduction histidine kinase
MLLSLLPGGLLAYYIYRYRYLDLTLRRSLSFAGLVVAVLLAHGLVIRRATDALEEAYKVDFALLEGALVVGVVVLFEPARRRLQAAIDAALAPDRGRRRTGLLALQAELASFPPGDLRPVVARAKAGLEEVFGANAVVCLRTPADLGSEEGEWAGDVTCAPPEASREVAQLLAWSAGAEARPFARDELPGPAAQAAGRAGVDAVVPVPGGGGEGGHPGVGFVALGTRPRGDALGQEDASGLGAVAGTLAAAARDAHVVRRLVALEHKLAEAEKLSSLGRLSATIAHEVKNPLSSIKTIVGVLRESMPEGDAASPDLAVVASEVDRLSAVVSNLLSIARPAKKPGEGTALVPPPEGFDAREMLEGLLAVLGPDARRRGVKLDTRFQATTPRVDARESAVRQAAFQLVLNAIEVTPAGGTVTLSTGPARDTTKGPPGEVEIVVEDTGPGLPPGGEDRVFEPFFSLKPQGTGLGLSIAKDEVLRAGGRIGASDREDGARGARFRMVLPAARRTAPT